MRHRFRLRHKSSTTLPSIRFVLSTILVVSVLVVIVTILTTDGFQSIISIPGSFAAVSARDITTTTTSDSLKTSNLQSSQQYSIVNNSSSGEINSSSISYSSSASKTKKPLIIDPNLTVEVVADGLNMPTTMAFLGTDS